MVLSLALCRSGYDDYWAEIATRPLVVREREKAFPALAERFRTRHPPHFTRDDLAQIIDWKYTDGRRRKKASAGLSRTSDAAIREATGQIATLDEPAMAALTLEPLIHGVGPAGVSAILAAASPRRFPVIDVYAVKALCHYDPQPWCKAVKFDKRGNLCNAAAIYPAYVQYCRQVARRLSNVPDTPEWRPRDVDIALWGLGKNLDDA